MFGEHSDADFEVDCSARLGVRSAKTSTLSKIRSDSLSPLLTSFWIGDSHHMGVRERSRRIEGSGRATECNGTSWKIGESGESRDPSLRAGET